MLVWLASCVEEPERRPPRDAPDPPAFAASPRIELPLSAEVRLVERVVAETDVPTRLAVVLDDGERRREITFPDLRADHDVPLLALLPETTYAADVTFTDADGRSVAASLSFTTDPAPDGIPDFTVLVADPERMEPGYTAFPASVAERVTMIAVDDRGRPVWTWATDVFEAGALQVVDGVFSSLLDGQVVRWTADGTVLGRWLEYGTTEATGVALPFLLHHEALFLPDGSFWTLRKEELEVDAYPTSALDPSVTAPAVVLDDHPIRLAPDGTVLEDLSLAERLDPERIGFHSLDTIGAAFDWSHANAIALTPAGDALLVSLRHQDAVVKLALPDGELEWILGNPDGWTPELDAKRLQPVGEPFGWPYHQHAPAWDDEGRLWLFDNGNFRDTTPYSGPPNVFGSISRVVAYEIDEDARTVRQVFEHGGDDQELFSVGYGNADPQPGAGTVLATFSGLLVEDGELNVTVGRGAQSVRVIEVDPAAGDVVFDLRISTDGEEHPVGAVIDRAIRVPTLYGPGVVERWLD